MNQNKQKGENYQSFLENLHGKLNTSDEIIESVVKQATGYGVQNKRKVVEGEVNEVYDITPKNGRNIIVRISREKDNRFESEKWALDKCNDAGVPVPQILLLNEVEVNQEKLHICVENKIEGISLQELIKQKSLNQSEIKELTANAGEILSKIHNIKTKGFGMINSFGVGEFKNWPEYMLRQHDNIEIVLREANKIGVEINLIHQAFKILEANNDIYMDIDSRLVHSDYGIKHIIVDNGRINGIIDFENCKGADVAYDFSWWNYFGKNRPPIEWLLEGYKRNANLDYNFETRMHLVKIKIALELLIYYGNVGHDYARNITTRNLTDDIIFFK